MSCFFSPIPIWVELHPDFFECPWDVPHNDQGTTLLAFTESIAAAERSEVTHKPRTNQVYRVPWLQQGREARRMAVFGKITKQRVESLWTGVPRLWAWSKETDTVKMEILAYSVIFLVFSAAYLLVMVDDVCPWVGAFAVSIGCLMIEMCSPTASGSTSSIFGQSMYSECKRSIRFRNLWSEVCIKCCSVSSFSPPDTWGL